MPGWPGPHLPGQAELVTQVGPERVVGHQGFSDLLREVLGQAATLVDDAELGGLGARIGRQLSCLLGSLGPFRVGL